MMDIFILLLISGLGLTGALAIRAVKTDVKNFRGEIDGYINAFDGRSTKIEEEVFCLKSLVEAKNQTRRKTPSLKTLVKRKKLAERKKRASDKKTKKSTSKR